MIRKQVLYLFVIVNFIFPICRVCFFYVSGICLKFPGPAHHPAGITYFTLRSVLSTTAVDICTPAPFLSLEFSLRLPQSLSNSVSNSIVLTIASGNHPLVTTLLKFMEDLNFKLENFSMTSFLRLEWNKCDLFLSTLAIHSLQPLPLLLLSINLLIYFFYPPKFFPRQCLHHL